MAVTLYKFQGDAIGARSVGSRQVSLFRSLRSKMKAIRGEKFHLTVEKTHLKSDSNRKCNFRNPVEFVKQVPIAPKASLRGKSAPVVFRVAKGVEVKPVLAAVGSGNNFDNGIKSKTGMFVVETRLVVCG